MMIKLVVFDLAGTTVHDGDAVNACFRAALSGRGIAAEPALVNSVMGLPKPEAIRILLEQCQRVAPTPEFIDAVHEDFTQRMCAYYADDPAVREVPGAAATFVALRRAGVKVALNSGFYRRIVAVLLARLGWLVPSVIDAHIASDEAPRGRPYPDMILQLMSRLDVADSSQVAKVGDTKVDLEEGTNAGCGIVVGVTTGSYSRQQLEAYPHTRILNSVADVPELILGKTK
jgi:phosphonatase-like hydrolase